MKRTFLFLLIVFCITANSQNIDLKKVLMMLPAEMVFELSKPEIETLFRTGTLKPKGNDANEAVVYKLDDYDNSLGDLKITMSFLTGKKGLFAKTELKAFKKNSGGYTIVYLNASGAPYFRPKALYVYDLIDGELIDNREYGMKKEVKVREFTTPNSTDSIYTICERHAHRCYYLTKTTSGNIEYALTIDTEFENSPWLKGNVILFKWTGETFEKELIDRK